MKKNFAIMRFFYGTIIGRVLLKIIMHLNLDCAIIYFLRSPWSKAIIPWYIKHNNIPISNAKQKTYKTFHNLFIRTRDTTPIDTTPGHLISPCDGWMSVFPINSHSCFSIKNSYYRLIDFLQNEELATNYENGLCLIFRLCASDYHRYCYIDNGFQGKNHHIPGVLHSVQPIAYEKYPVFVLNKRCWCLLTTEHFGPVVQCEIGALIVGKIVNNHEDFRFCKGDEKGHFELSGSTIIMLFEKGQIKINSKLINQLSSNSEVRVKQGEWIATAERI